MDASHLMLFLCFVAVLLWGAWGFFGKLALSRDMPPLSMFFAEVSVGFVAAIMIVFIGSLAGQPAPWKAPWSWFGVLSGASMAIGLVIYYFALEKGNATIVVPLTACYPLVTVILSVAMLGERCTTLQWLGVVMVVGGMVLLSLHA